MKSTFDSCWTNSFDPFIHWWLIFITDSKQRAIDFSPWGLTRTRNKGPFSTCFHFLDCSVHTCNTHTCSHSLTHCRNKKKERKKNSRALLSPPAASFIFVTFFFPPPHLHLGDIEARACGEREIKNQWCQESTRSPKPLRPIIHSYPSSHATSISTPRLNTTPTPNHYPQ